jgi:hypothetical protein
MIFIPWTMDIQYLWLEQPRERSVRDWLSEYNAHYTAPDGKGIGITFDTPEDALVFRLKYGV